MTNQEKKDNKKDRGKEKILQDTDKKRPRQQSQSNQARTNAQGGSEHDQDEVMQQEINMSRSTTREDSTNSYELQPSFTVGEPSSSWAILPPPPPPPPPPSDSYFALYGEQPSSNASKAPTSNGVLPPSSNTSKAPTSDKLLQSSMTAYKKAVVSDLAPPPFASGPSSSSNGVPPSLTSGESSAAANASLPTSSSGWVPVSTNASQAPTSNGIPRPSLNEAVEALLSAMEEQELAISNGIPRPSFTAALEALVSALKEQQLALELSSAPKLANAALPSSTAGDAPPPPPSDPTHQVPPPLNPSTLLKLQSRHRSESVRNGDNLKILACRQRQGSPILLNEQCRQLLVVAGLDSLAALPRLQQDASLITALVERWRPETHTFHFPVGEMTVTLQDVAVLFGLNVEGKPLTIEPDTERGHWRALLQMHLGLNPTQEELQGNMLKIRYLGENFQGLPAADDEDTVRRHTTAWLLYELGTVIFPDTCSDTLPLQFLSWITDLEEAREYNWGGAALAWLYHNLCRASLDDKKQLSGPLLLVQIWAWLRLPIAKPRLKIEQQQIVWLESEFIAAYWEKGKRSWLEGARRNLELYRDEMDHFKEDAIKWEPYNDQQFQGVDRFVLANQRDKWLKRRPLIFTNIVETYCPHRVMRQFGLYQDFPPTRYNVHDFLHRHNLRFSEAKTNHWRLKYWNACNASSAGANGVIEPRPYDHSTYDAYITWFSGVSLLRIKPQPLVAQVDPESTVLPKTNITGPMAFQLMEILLKQIDCMLGRISLQELSDFTLQRIRILFQDSGMKSLALSLPSTLTPAWKPEIVAEDQPMHVPEQTLAVHIQTNENPVEHTQSGEVVEPFEDPKDPPMQTLAEHLQQSVESVQPSEVPNSQLEEDELDDGPLIIKRAKRRRS